MRFFYKNSGTISVFLSLILLPVLLVGGMTVDASRIYMSKIVISDAGEMAMNAGLARYNEVLHDEYGLFAMEESPEAMSDDLEVYFQASLNGTGLPDAADYDKILDLLEKEFEAINVTGSEIYRTEVEKQQILEYMKYRAPVCLTELVVNKIQELKDTKKMTEAMEAEMDFSEAMEDCQDAFQEAKTALDTLDRAIESFPSEQAIKAELSGTQTDYKEIVARCLLMRAVIQNYNDKDLGIELEDAAEAFVASAKKVNLSSPYSRETFNNYVDSLYYMNTVDSLGGIDMLQETGSQTEETDDGETEVSSGTDHTTLITEYKQQKTRIEGYSTNSLLSAATDAVSSHSAALNNYRAAAETAERAARTAYNKLETVKKKLTDAEKKFKVWETKNDALKAVGKSESMDEEVRYYQKFFSEGTGKSVLENLETLMAAVAADQSCFGDWKKALADEKFFGQSIAVVDSATQMNRYITEAQSYVRGIAADYSSVENVRASYISNYESAQIPDSGSPRRIHDDPFYRQLQEYCDTQNETDSQKEQDEANGNLNQSKSAGKEAEDETGYPDFNWGNVSVTLPSTLTNGGSSDADGALSDLDADGNVKKKSARRDIISKFKSSIKAANSFLDGVDRIVENGLENLYVAEYAMQMFSYYTVDKNGSGQSRADSEIISISGYPFKDRAAYRAECEYILWGDQASQSNIRKTVMMIFGIRMLFNSFYAFTNAEINIQAQAMATAIAGAAPYLIPIVKVVIKLGYAGVETANDISKIKQGYGVSIFKTSATWATGGGDNTKGVTFDYSEYLRVFLNLSLLAGYEEGILGRIADCIQVNKPDISLKESYTMLAVQADVSTRTTFMRKISDWGESGAWGFPDDSYTITYQSILGY